MLEESGDRGWGARREIATSAAQPSTPSPYITGRSAGSLHNPSPSALTPAARYQQSWPGVAPLPTNFASLTVPIFLQLLAVMGSGLHSTTYASALASRFQRTSDWPGAPVLGDFPTS